MAKIKDLPQSDRPREKLIKKGSEALTTNELLAIILRTGIKNKNALQVARDIWQKYSQKKLATASFSELRNIKGVGSTKAVQILAAIELGRRLFKEKLENETFINSTADVLKEIDSIKSNKKENFVALYLDARNKLIYQETVSIGSLNSSLVHPREVFEPAIQHLAVRIILAHNHPSGDPEPSSQDIEITKRLAESGKILGIEITDHIILAKNGFISFKAKRLL